MEIRFKMMIFTPTIKKLLVYQIEMQPKPSSMHIAMVLVMKNLVRLLAAIEMLALKLELSFRKRFLL